MNLYKKKYILLLVLTIVYVGCVIPVVFSCARCNGSQIGDPLLSFPTPCNCRGSANTFILVTLNILIIRSTTLTTAAFGISTPIYANYHVVIIWIFCLSFSV